MWNRVDPTNKDAFQAEYELCNEELAPKGLHFGIHLEESKVEAVGKRVGMNGYRYASPEVVDWVRKIELL